MSATLQAARVEVGPSGYICADVSHFQPTLTESAEGDIVPDNFQGEIATVYNVRDRGLVIISSCGHSGIVNTIKHVQAVTGIDKVHAVVGGIHLPAAPETIVAKTADAFQKIQPDYEEQERTGFRYAYSIYQVEYSRNLLFMRGSQLEQVFQRMVDRTRARLCAR